MWFPNLVSTNSGAPFLPGPWLIVEPQFQSKNHLGSLWTLCIPFDTEIGPEAADLKNGIIIKSLRNFILKLLGLFLRKTLSLLPGYSLLTRAAIVSNQDLRKWLWQSCEMDSLGLVGNQVYLKLVKLAVKAAFQGEIFLPIQIWNKKDNHIRIPN